MHNFLMTQLVDENLNRELKYSEELSKTFSGTVLRRMIEVRLIALVLNIIVHI